MPFKDFLRLERLLTLESEIESMILNYGSFLDGMKIPKEEDGVYLNLLMIYHEAKGNKTTAAIFRDNLNRLSEQYNRSNVTVMHAQGAIARAIFWKN